MSGAELKRDDHGHQQRIIDEAMINKVRDQRREDADVNRIRNKNGDNHKRDVSQKKAGGVR
jgi:hypothetical protein